MADGIEIRFVIDDRLGEYLGRAVAACDDMTPEMKAIAVHLEATTRERFETETGPDGKRWKPSRRAIEEGGQTLTLTGDLKSSIRADWGKTHAEVGAERSFGAAVYAAIHQFGGIIRPTARKALSFGGGIFAQVVMPARPFIGFSQASREAIEEILRGFVRRVLPGGAS